MQFASPHYLWLLTLLAPMTAYYVWRTMQGGAAIRISTVAGVLHAPKTVRHYLRHLPFALRAAAFALLVGAGATAGHRTERPHEHRGHRHRAGHRRLGLDARPRLPARPHHGRQGGGRLVRRRPLRRPHRTGGLRRRSLHAKPPDHGPEHAPDAPGAHPQRTDRRQRHGHRQRTGHGDQPPARERGQVEGHHPADRRREQPRTDRSP